jgi:hypothetical protein
MGFLEEKSMQYTFGLIKKSEIKMIRKWRGKVIREVIKGRSGCTFKEMNGEKITIGVLNAFLDNGFDMTLVKETAMKYYIHISWNRQKEKDDKSRGKFIYMDSKSVDRVREGLIPKGEDKK